MRLEAILVANGAEIVNGLLNVAGAGWETYTSGLFPNNLAGVVCGVFVLEAADFESQPTFAIRGSDPHGQLDRFEAAGIVDTSRPQAQGGGASRIPFAVPFSTVVRGPTIATIEFSADGKILAELSVSIMSAIPDIPAE
jgi:hypothetical protein